MVRRAGIHRIAAVVAKRSTRSGQLAGRRSEGSDGTMEQLDLFDPPALDPPAAPQGAAVELTDPSTLPRRLGRDEAAAPSSAAPVSPDGAVRLDAAPEGDGDPTSIRDGAREVAPCPICTWWIEPAAARCVCCGAALADGALALQVELAFTGARVALGAGGEVQAPGDAQARDPATTLSVRALR
jgi:hypothetical protein